MSTEHVNFLVCLNNYLVAPVKEFHIHEFRVVLIKKEINYSKNSIYSFIYYFSNLVNLPAFPKHSVEKKGCKKLDKNILQQH